MGRVQFRTVIFAFSLAFMSASLQGCATFFEASGPHSGPAAGVITSNSTVAVSMDRDARIVGLKDVSGAVFTAPASVSAEQAKLYSMLAAFEHCQTQSKFAFVLTPSAISPTEFITPFECLSQRHGVVTPILLSEEVPAVLVQSYARDSRGALLARQVEPNITGLKDGDVILAVGGKRISSRPEMKIAVDALPVGPTKYSVVRSNHVIQVDGEITDRTESLRKNARALLTAICASLPSSSSVKACAPRVASL